MLLSMNQNDEAKIMRDFCTKVRNRRYELNLTQLKVSELIPCHLNTFGKIENGKCRPSLIMIVKIARALQSSPKDFLPEE